MPERLLLSLAIIGLMFSAFAFTRGLHLLLLRRGGQARVTARLQPTVLYFRTESCGPCVVQSRYLDQLQKDLAGQVYVEKIDAEADPDCAARFGIFTVPTTLIVDPSGAVRHANYGLTDSRKLAHQVKAVAGASAAVL